MAHRHLIGWGGGSCLHLSLDAKVPWHWEDTRLVPASPAASGHPKLHPLAPSCIVLHGTAGCTWPCIITGVLCTTPDRNSSFAIVWTSGHCTFTICPIVLGACDVLQIPSHPPTIPAIPAVAGLSHKLHGLARTARAAKGRCIIHVCTGAHTQL